VEKILRGGLADFIELSYQIRTSRKGQVMTIWERDAAKCHYDHTQKKATLVVILTYVPIFALNLEVFLLSLSLFIRIEHDQNAA
jgi:hypothetical protein